MSIRPLLLIMLGLAGCSIAKNVNTTIDDTDIAVAYETYPDWNTNVWSEQSPQPFNGTNHGTPNPGASVKFDFIGTAGHYSFMYPLVDN